MMRTLIRVAAAALVLGLPSVTHAQGGRGAALKQEHTLAAPAWITAKATPTGVQLEWANVPDAFEYWLYVTDNPSMPDTGLLGNVPAKNVAPGKTPGFFDRGRNAAVEYRVRAVDANHKRGPEARASYTPPPTKIPLPLPKKP